MTLKETMQQLDQLLTRVVKDLPKVHRGNKSAAQRIRVGTIKLERVAKLFRRESVAQEKGGRLKKTKLKARKKKR
jgi:hypothetical protein